MELQQLALPRSQISYPNTRGLNTQRKLNRPRSISLETLRCAGATQILHQNSKGRKSLRLASSSRSACPRPGLRCRASAAPATSAPPSPPASGEDFHKAGGSEREFVQMQAEKEAEGQGPIETQLERLHLGEGASGTQCLDVAVVGCGPSGLALAAELGSLGLAVGLLGKDSPFVNNYGAWLDEFQDLGFGACVEQVWEDTLLYTEPGWDSPIQTGRAYARVDRTRLRDELLSRCKRAGVRHLAADVDSLEEQDDSGSTVITASGDRIRARLVVIAAGAASGKFLKYGESTQGVGVQTAYGIEVELEAGSEYPYDPRAMLFMDYRDIPGEPSSREGAFGPLPSFLYAMPSTPQRVFFEETCLAARPAMPFSILKERLHLRLQSLGVRYSKVLDEEWSYIPVGGDLPNTSQQTLGFGAAACLVHPATGYSLTKSLGEAPGYAAAIAAALKSGTATSASAPLAAQEAWSVLWSPERKRQRAFMIFGLELILQLDVPGTREFFATFFKLPTWLWKGFLASSLSSVDLLFFALCTFAVASNNLRFQLVKALFTLPSGARMIRTYLGQEEH